jgi:hypothetical protein
VRGICALVVVTLGLAGCGGSSSNGERSKLAGQVSSQLKSSGAPPDITSCVGQKAQALPIGQLRAVASAGSNPPQPTKQIAVHLLATCISEGHGISVLHQAIVHAIVQSAPGSLPPAYTNCIISKANSTTPAQLSQLVDAYASEDQTAAQAQARQVGENLGRQCLGAPGVLTAFRGIFVKTFKAGFASAHYSRAFENCLLGKVEQVPDSLLKQSALNPSGASAVGQAFGRNAAKSCIASGIKP